MKTYIILTIIYFVWSAILGAIEGYRDAKNGTDIDHSKDFWKRVTLGLIFAFPLNYYGIWLIKPVDPVFVISVLIAFMVVGAGFLYGLCLNIAHNLFKKKPLGYIGNTAETDKLLRKNKIDKIGMLIFFLGACFFYIFLLQLGNRGSLE